jgi:hypothetical protein
MEVPPPGLEERIYFGSYEIYRQYPGNGTTVSLERETLNVMDDRKRIAMVESRSVGNDDSPTRLVRYQYSNKLGSACLELDGDANMVSYEE